MFYRFLTIFGLLLTSATLSACGGKGGNLARAEWEDLKAHDFGADLKKFTGLGQSVADKEDFGLQEDYCTGPKWTEGRRLFVSGVGEDDIAYGGCILEAPLPYEPQRLWGRP